VQHGFRSRVWRELPFSARRAIVGTLRTVDQIDEFIADFWRSLQYSPAWLFVACAGSAGLVLTVLLFLSLAQELSASATNRRGPPIIESELAALTQPDELDSRLCLEDIPVTAPSYAADFRFLSDRTAVHTVARAPARDVLPPIEFDDFPPVERRPRTASRATAPTLPDVSEPILDVKPTGKADVQPLLEFSRHRLPSSAHAGAPETLVARAAAPVTDRAAESALVPRGADGWQWQREPTASTITPPQPYAGDPDAVAASAGADEEAPFADVHAWPNRAEVALRLELHAPPQSALSQPGRSSLVIRNAGSETLRRLLVSESLRPLDVVTNALPAAQVSGDLLHREVLRLRTGRERTLSLDWFPQSTRDRHHEVVVLAEAFVSASVDVTAAPLAGPLEPTSGIEVEPPTPTPVTIQPRPREPAPARELPVEESPREETLPPEVPRAKRQPAVECVVQTARSVAVDDVVEVTIEVRNTGETSLHNVRIWADVPPALRHRHGAELEYQVGRLSPGQTHQAVLRVVGEQAGRAVTNIRVIADEPVEAAAAARLAVVEQASTPQPVRQPVRRSVPVRGNCCGCYDAPPVYWIGAAF
jgi:hypothetical protein